MRKSARFASGYFLHTSAGFRSAEEPHILKCPSGDVPLSKLPFGDYLWSNVDKHKSRTALVIVFTFKLSNTFWSLLYVF